MNPYTLLQLVAGEVSKPSGHILLTSGLLVLTVVMSGNQSS